MFFVIFYSLTVKRYGPCRDRLSIGVYRLSVNFTLKIQYTQNGLYNGVYCWKTFDPTSVPWGQEVTIKTPSAKEKGQIWDTWTKRPESYKSQNLIRYILNQIRTSDFSLVNLLTYHTNSLTFPPTREWDRLGTIKESVCSRYMFRESFKTFKKK